MYRYFLTLFVVQPHLKTNWDVEGQFWNTSSYSLLQTIFIDWNNFSIICLSMAMTVVVQLYRYIYFYFACLVYFNWYVSSSFSSLSLLPSSSTSFSSPSISSSSSLLFHFLFSSPPSLPLPYSFPLLFFLLFSFGVEHWTQGFTHILPLNYRTSPERFYWSGMSLKTKCSFSHTFLIYYPSYLF